MSHKISRIYDHLPLVSVAEARASGSKRYFTGKPCKRGHVGPRYLGNSKCVVCSAEGALAWEKKMYLEQPDEMRRRGRARRHADPIGEIIRVARSREKKKGIEVSISRDDLP